MVLRKLSQSFKITLAVMLSVLSSGILQVAPAYADAPDKVFVCKYIGTPFSDERLQSSTESGGGNPLSVSVNSIPNYQGPGSYFADQHGQSFVLAVDNTAPGPAGDPSASACPAPRGPVTVVPAEFTPPTCDNPGTLIGIDTAQYTFNRTGPETAAVLTATPVGNVTLTGTTVFGPHDLTQVTGDECDEDTTTYVTPVATPSHQTSVCVEGSEVFTSGSINVTAMEGLHYWVNGSEITTGSIELAPGTYEVSFTTDENYELAEGEATTVSVTINPASELECDRPDSEEVTLCHATHSAKNPFVRITVSAAGAFNGHLDDDFGGTHGNHQDGEDIIPPFIYNGKEYSQNWEGRDELPEDCAPLSPQPCPVPANGGAINAGSIGWNLVGDAEFVNLALSISSNNWVDGGISYTGTYPLAEAEQLAWMLNDAGVSGAYGVGILLETSTGEVIHYEPEPYTDDFWSNSPVLPANAGGQGGPYSGSLQDALNTIGNVNIVKTTFVFTSAELNEDVLLTSLSFNCNIYTFAPVGGMGGPETPTTPPQVLGTTAPQTLGTSTELPAALPATGGESNPFLILLASLMAYGVAYFLQGRRQLNRNHA